MQNIEWIKIKHIFNQTLDLPRNERDVFLSKQSAFVQTEVRELIKSHENAEDFIVEPAIVEFGFSQDVNIGQQIGDYKIIAPIGVGGMGSVYLAERIGFEQKVAVKLIKRGMDTRAVLKRFKLERQILSRLNHPNIAKLLDGGETKDGLPYFVLEYIEGETIIKFCEHHQFDVDERLELFRKVCDAISYAHQNLIVHRDIKPSNIIVTNDGTPKLLDFGIAKLLDNEIDSTATIGRMFTPEYASPEQINGLPITTATDVYSLGVVLYELLSGVRPFTSKSRSYGEIANLVLTQEPSRPSSAVINHLRSDSETKQTNENKGQRTKDEGQRIKSLIGDLDNIILKALRKESDRRYQSVSDFSADIKCHLQGLPVTATADSKHYRFKKFVNRHKQGVAIGSIVGFLILAISGVAIWQAIVANRERAKAEARFNDVRQLAKSIIFEFHDSIEKLPGSTPTRELLISRSLEYLDKIAFEATQDSSLQMELADAYERIGNIQGGFNTAHLGLREKSFDSYSKALSIRENLFRAEPSNVVYRRKLADSYSKMSDALWIKTDVVGSLENQQKAFEISKKLGDEFPNDKEINYELALAQSKLGRLLGANGRTEESLANARQAVKIMEELAAYDSNNRKIMQSLAICYNRVAEILTSLTENHSEARALTLKSQEISLKLLSENPNDMALKRIVAISYLDIGIASIKLSDDKTALENLQKSLSMFEQLLSEDPKNEEFRMNVAATEIELCYVFIKTGKASEAITGLKKSLITFEKLKAQSPTDQLVSFRIAVVCEYLGKGYAFLASEKNSTMQNSLTNWQEARKVLQKSHEIYKEFRDSGKTVGAEAAKADELAAEIAKCDIAISNIQ
jgi:eukaryotic-like serine/threonine-protein kinase